jgi:hypothetical protein
LSHDDGPRFATVAVLASAAGDRDLFQAQLDLAQLQLQDTLTVGQLYKALGGEGSNRSYSRT